MFSRWLSSSPMENRERIHYPSPPPTSSSSPSSPTSSRLVFPCLLILAHFYTLPFFFLLLLVLLSFLPSFTFTSFFLSRNRGKHKKKERLTPLCNYTLGEKYYHALEKSLSMWFCLFGGLDRYVYLFKFSLIFPSFLEFEESPELMWFMFIYCTYSIN